jgi:hypothetical protein
MPAISISSNGGKTRHRQMLRLPGGSEPPRAAGERLVGSDSRDSHRYAKAIRLRHFESQVFNQKLWRLELRSK